VYTYLPTTRWLLEEDARLRAALGQQQNVSEGVMYDWRAVAAVVGTKTYTQCSRRWKRALHPNLKKGRWTIVEDEKLTDIVTKGNTKWTAIATVLGRTSKQVCGIGIHSSLYMYMRV
jgi:Myb-like DNA-binding domain